MKVLNFVSTYGIALATLFATSLVAEENVYQKFEPAAISSAAGTPWNAARQLSLVEKAKTMESSLNEGHKLAYPISEDQLKELYGEKGTVTFFAYSSMIDKNAGASKAISPEAAATQEPAIAFGIQRIFNQQMDASVVESGFGKLARPNDLAILNSFPKKDAVVNGVIFELPVADLHLLTKREVGYNLVPVLAMRWNNAMDVEKTPEIFVAYTFQAPDVTTEGTPYTSEHVNPIPGYVNNLQAGLDALGDDFKAMWWNTTFLADKKTPITELPYHNVDLREKVDHQQDKVDHQQDKVDHQQ